MQSFRYIVVAILLMSVLAFLSDILFASRKPQPEVESIYDFKMTSLDGDEIDFSRYRGKYLLVVNTASKCGYTPQYRELQELHEKYGDRIAVLGFPANNFLWQEPGTDDEIAAFCEKNYGVTFQMFSKISVKGRDQHPLYTWLESKTRKAPRWNFCKYVIDPAGMPVAFYPSKVSPLDPEILKKLELLP